MILYVDMFSGISGDMMLGGLIDLGVPVSWLQDQLSGIFKGFRLEAKQKIKKHLRATDLVVKIKETEGCSRNYADIHKMIAESDLPEKVKQNSLKAFEKIGEAEARIHGKDMDSVHFHEVGAVDSLVDIIGSFLAVEYLKIKKTIASVVPLGSGVVTCSHGTIPVPVPATLAILKDIPVKGTKAETEIVTPTGAAIISTLCSRFGPMPEMTIKKIGYGSGKRDTGLPTPNLLRLVLGEENKTVFRPVSHIYTEKIFTLKTNIDDMNPELTGCLMPEFFKKGALDVTITPVQMKKNRPGIQLEVMCKKDNLEELVETILSRTSSTGVRCLESDRYYLAREPVEIQTAFGRLIVKKIIRPDGKEQIVPEYETAVEAAVKTGMPLEEVYRQIICDAAALDRE